jgi:enoyl-CoA hydratase
MGLINRVAEPGKSLEYAIQLAQQLAALPQTCLRNDRLSAYQQWAMSEQDAIRNEFQLGMQTLASGEAVAGAKRFTAGSGRHGANEEKAKAND